MLCRAEFLGILIALDWHDEREGDAMVASTGDEVS